jgi:hypothetical protein
MLVWPSVGAHPTFPTRTTGDMLSSQQIDVYLRDGILVVDDLLSHDEVIEARAGLASTLLNEFGVNVCDLEGTGINLLAASFNGAGAFFVSLRAR